MFKKANWDPDVSGHEAYQELFQKPKRKLKKKAIIKKKHNLTHTDEVKLIKLSDKKVSAKTNKVTRKVNQKDLSSESKNAEVLTKSKKKRLKRLNKKLKLRNKDIGEEPQTIKIQKKKVGNNKNEDNTELNGMSTKQIEKIEHLKEKRKQKRLKSKLKAINTIQSSTENTGISLEGHTVGLNERKHKNRKIGSLVSKKMKDLFKNDSNDNKLVDKITNRNQKFLDKLKGTLNETKEKKPILSLRERMMKTLKAARFRFLNEEIYTSDSKETQKLFQSDPEAFEAYHDGYRQQVKRWVMNPLDNIIKDIRKMPKTIKVADFGCGDARLSRSVPHEVFSFDLVAANDSVTACDMSKVPLEDGSVDVVVFCLSLMGTNLSDYLKEAFRVMKDNGILKIAEVESRFEDVDKFIVDLQKYGFKNIMKDLSHNLFYFLDFKKQSSTRNKKQLPKLTLLPCLYKKR